MTTIINLTPHAITLVNKDGSTIAAIAPSGTVARCSSTVTPTGTVNVNGIAVDVVKTVFGDVQNLPAPQDGTVYIASTLVAQAAKRADVLSPGAPVRNADGQVIGCQGFQSFD